MQEQIRYQMALMAAEAMYMLWALGHQEDERDLDAMMRRLPSVGRWPPVRETALSFQYTGLV